MKEIDAVVQVIYRKSNIIYSKPIIDQNDEGDVGEIFCKYGVKQVFFDKGFYAIKGSNKTKNIPIMIITGVETEREQLQDQMKEKEIPVLSKPLSAEQVVGAVDYLL